MLCNPVDQMGWHMASQYRGKKRRSTEEMYMYCEWNSGEKGMLRISTIWHKRHRKGAMVVVAAVISKPG